MERRGQSKKENQGDCEDGSNDYGNGDGATHGFTLPKFSFPQQGWGAVQCPNVLFELIACKKRLMIFRQMTIRHSSEVERKIESDRK